MEKRYCWRAIGISQVATDSADRISSKGKQERRLKAGARAVLQSFWYGHHFLDSRSPSTLVIRGVGQMNLEKSFTYMFWAQSFV